MISIVDKLLEKIGLSEDDFFYDVDTDILYHWSGVCITRDALISPASRWHLATELNLHLQSLPNKDKEEKLVQFRLYQKHYNFICEFKGWLMDRIIAEAGIKSIAPTDTLRDFEVRQELYREKRREYIPGWEQGKKWHARDLTDKVPTDLKQAVVEAWDFVITYQKNREQ